MEKQEKRYNIITNMKINLFWFNLYSKYIEKHKNTPRLAQKNYQRHHIVPLCIGGGNQDENLVSLTRFQHRCAHWLLKKAYPDNNHLKIAYQMMQNGTSDESYLEIRRLAARISHPINRQNGVGVFNHHHQIAAARASMLRPDALEIRRKAGEIGGKNAKRNIVIQPSQRFCFSFKNQERVCIFNCDLGSTVVQILNTIEPETGLRRASNLLSGKRRSASGWTCKLIEPSVDA